MTRQDPPVQGDERAMLVGWLDFHRETLAMKVEGLTTEKFAARPIPNSMMSLLGLVRHLTEIERTYFRAVFGGEELPDLAFDDDPFGETPAGDWLTAGCHTGSCRRCLESRVGSSGKDRPGDGLS